MHMRRSRGILKWWPDPEPGRLFDAAKPVVNSLSAGDPYSSILASFRLLGYRRRTFTLPYPELVRSEFLRRGAPLDSVPDGGRGRRGNARAGFRFSPDKFLPWHCRPWRFSRFHVKRHLIIWILDYQSIVWSSGKVRRIIEHERERETGRKEERERERRGRRAEARKESEKIDESGDEGKSTSDLERKKSEREAVAREGELHIDKDVLDCFTPSRIIESSQSLLEF